MPSTELVVKILGKSITLQRLPLRGWAKLEEIKKAIDDAISTKDSNNYFLALVQFIEMASSTPPKIEWDKLPWFEFLSVYSDAIRINTPSLQFPVLVGEKGETKKQPWEYEGRSWYFWLNLFAKNYGWNEEVIGEMDIDTAIGLYQEILIDGQFEKEWQYSITEIAYEYQEHSKKSVYKPLDRPEWMLPLAPTQLPIVKMRKDMMPMGNIIDMQAEEQKRRDKKRGI